MNPDGYRRSFPRRSFVLLEGIFAFSLPLTFLPDFIIDIGLMADSGVGDQVFLTDCLRDE